MAVEAPHINLFPSSQLITNRDFWRTNQVDTNLYYDTQMDSGLYFNETMQSSALFPFYQSFVCDPILAKSSMNKDDSGLTCNFPASRKRLRDPINESSDAFTAIQKTKFSNSSSLIDEDILYQIQQQQSEIDCFVAENTHKLRMEIEERRKKQSRILIPAIQEAITKKMKEKDEDIQRMGKLNWFLQEKVKNLYVENQIWRDLAQTNEATATSLRNNLEQVLAHVSEDRHVSGADAESSCGSSDYQRRRTLIVEEEKEATGRKDNSRICKKCGERESSVLLLPCRHLCLCTLCGSTLLGNCPVCDSGITASVHVNLS